MATLWLLALGLNEGRFTFFNRRDQAIQFLAVEDIGKFVAAIFRDPARFAGQTLEIASDAMTGSDLEACFTEAAGRPISYSRFPDEMLAANPFLAGLTALVDTGPLAGNADFDALRKINPEMLRFRAWLAGTGREAFQRALGTSGSWTYNDA